MSTFEIFMTVLSLFVLGFVCFCAFCVYVVRTIDKNSLDYIQFILDNRRKPEDARLSAPYYFAGIASAAWLIAVAVR